MRFSAWKKHETKFSIVSLILLTTLIVLFVIEFYSILSHESLPEELASSEVSGVTDVVEIDISPTVKISPRITIVPTKSLTISPRMKVLAVLNSYRIKYGVPPVVINEKLHTFAQSRADQFTLQSKMDNHEGFQAMLNENGFSTLGFNALGENSSYGEWGSEQNLIEIIYASSADHNTNQLNSEWTHVGIGISGTATNIVFGGKKR